MVTVNTDAGAVTFEVNAAASVNLCDDEDLFDKDRDMNSGGTRKMAAANNEFFEALSMLEHERGITAEYLIEKIKAAIVIAVKKNYEVEDDNVLVDIDPDSGAFHVALCRTLWPRRTGTTSTRGQPGRGPEDPQDL